MEYYLWLLAEDEESGKLIEDGYSQPFYEFGHTKRNEKAECLARESCKSWGIKYIAHDGPYRLWFLWWPWRTPKWRTNKPPGFEGKWSRTLKLKELQAYRDGHASREES